MVTGATGYIGGRLVPLLLNKGYRVRAIARSRSKVSCRPWAQHPNLEIAVADLLDYESLTDAVKGCSAVFYLVHSMKSGIQDQEGTDRQAARNMARAAFKEGVERIIYLSDLGVNSANPSKHLRSRAEVGHILQASSVPATILRSSIILGSGSASFELIRYLTERTPLIFAPKWMDTLTQPISVRNVLGYLAGCLEETQTTGNVYDIGGPDVLTYEDIFRIYAQESGFTKRFIIKLPFLNSKLLAWFAHLITPIPANLAETLIDSFRDKAICRDQDIKRLIPQELLSCREAITVALQKVSQDRVQTCWMDAGDLDAPEWIVHGDVSYAGGTVLECAYKVVLQGSAREVWPMLESIGGSRGWYGMDVLWRIRGDMDRLVGGPGLRRGRRHQSHLQVGDALDFWRVLKVDPPNALLLLSEMRLPGEAMLEFRLRDLPGGKVEVVQIARFLPSGLTGLVYWYLSYPLHGLVFRSMLLNISRYSGHSVLSGPTMLREGYQNWRQD
ncbi:MAG: SDR family oxidoreductase [Thermodesulfobacteriota bacterium]